MQRLKPSIKDVSQLEPLDLVFSVQEEDKIFQRIRAYFRYRRFKRNYPDADETLCGFNTVRMFWGNAFMHNESLCLEWIQSPISGKWTSRISFMTAWVLQSKNAWIMRHPSVIASGLHNRGEIENVIGRWYMQDNVISPYADIFTVYQRSGYPLPGSINRKKNIHSLLLSSKLVFINS